jgi:acylphosphatase
MFIYTALLMLMLLYWAIVLMGALDLDFLDGIFGAADGAAEGAVEGAVDGVVEGAVDGAMDGALDGAFEGTVDGAVEGVADGAADAAADGAVEAVAEGTGSALRAVLAFLNLGQVPATLILSVLVIFMWSGAYIINTTAPEWLRGWFPPVVFFVVVFGVSFALAYFLTGLTTRPLRKYFRITAQRGHEHLIGKICIIRSGRVTPQLGRAEMTIGESFLTIDVRAPEEEELKKRDEAVIVEYYKESDAYEVRKL